MHAIPRWPYFSMSSRSKWFLTVFLTSLSECWHLFSWRLSLIAKTMRRGIWKILSSTTCTSPSKLVNCSDWLGMFPAGFKVLPQNRRSKKVAGEAHFITTEENWKNPTSGSSNAKTAQVRASTYFKRVLSIDSGNDHSKHFYSSGLPVLRGSWHNTTALKNRLSHHWQARLNAADQRQVLFKNGSEQPKFFQALEWSPPCCALL